MVPRTSGFRQDGNETDDASWAHAILVRENCGFGGRTMLGRGEAANSYWAPQVNGYICSSSKALKVSLPGIPSAGGARMREMSRCGLGQVIAPKLDASSCGECTLWSIGSHFLDPLTRSTQIIDASVTAGPHRSESLQHSNSQINGSARLKSPNS